MITHKAPACLLAQLTFVSMLRIDKGVNALGRSGGVFSKHMAFHLAGHEPWMGQPLRTVVDGQWKCKWP